MAKKKAKKKEWVTIFAPKMFKEKEIGKVPISDPAKVAGKRLTSTLMDLTNDFNKYYLKLSFKVVKLEGNKAFTEFDKLECMQDYVSRMVLKRSTRVDTIQDLVTKDGKKLRVKTIAIIPRRVKSSIKTTVRNKIRELIEDAVTKKTMEKFVEEVMSDKMKHKVLTEARGIYPVRSFEVRKLEVLSK